MTAEQRFVWSALGPPPDRVYLEQTLLTELATEGPSMLFVGVADYTDHYNIIVGDTVRFVTTDASLDIDEHGKPEFTFNVSDQEFPSQIKDALHQKGESFSHFDSVVLNGVIGWGMNTEAEIRQAFHNCYQLMRPGGKLLVGWNSPEFPTKINLSDERLLSLIQKANFTIKPINGDDIFTGPQANKWSPQMHADYQFHRYVLVEKPLYLEANRDVKRYSKVYHEPKK